MRNERDRRVIKGGYRMNCCFPWMPKVLPLVYNDALSYMENVYALIDWCNKLCEEIRTTYNTLHQEIELAEQNSNKYTDTQLQNFRVEFAALVDKVDKEIAQLIKDTQAEVERLENELKEYESKVDAELKAAIEQLEKESEELREEVRAELLDFEQKFAEFKHDINSEVIRLDSHVTELWTAFNKYRVQTNAYIDFKCEELKHYVDAHTSVRNGNNILVYNPVISNTDTLKKTLVDLYNTNFYGAITADDYAALDLTAQEYAGYELTAWEYAVTARFVFFDLIYFRGLYAELEQFRKDFEKLLQDVDNSLHMTNPITGKYEYIHEVVEMLASYHMNDLTAQEYADKDWSADDYAALNWTAQYYATSSAGELGRILGGDAHVISLQNTSLDIINNVMDKFTDFPRDVPLLINIIALDGYATGQGFVVDTHGIFLLANTVDVIRMVYDNGTWTTIRI